MYQQTIEQKYTKLTKININYVHLIKNILVVTDPDFVRDNYMKIIKMNENETEE